MRIRKAEIPLLLKVWESHKKGSAYSIYLEPEPWPDNLVKFDYLRGLGLVTNGADMAYGTIRLTDKGLKFVKEVCGD